MEDLLQVIMDALVRKRDALDLKKPCAECGKVVPAPNRCGRCKSVIYCSQECQYANWKAHKKSCQPPSAQTDMGSLTFSKPSPPAPDHGLKFQYLHSPDNSDVNLLIVLHGNGDNEQNFGRYCSKWMLNLTAVLSVRAPLPLGNQGQMWFPDAAAFGPDYVFAKGDRARIRPCVEAAELLVQIIRAAERQWPPHRIFVFGHGQGGVVAVEAASRYEKYLGCVVASGDCLLDEVVKYYEPPTMQEKKQCDLLVGESMKFKEVEVSLASAQSPKPDDVECKQWRYEIVLTHKEKPDTKSVYTVVCDKADFGNARARGRLINAYDGVFRLRISGYQVDAIAVTIETTVEAPQDELKKSATRIFYTRGAKDDMWSPKLADSKVDYLRRHFRFVEEHVYKERKNVIGSDPDELSDITAFIRRCEVHQALRYVPPVAGRIKG